MFSESILVSNHRKRVVDVVEVAIESRQREKFVAIKMKLEYLARGGTTKGSR